jgi:truncated hemoglobin YjbI
LALRVHPTWRVVLVKEVAMNDGRTTLFEHAGGSDALRRFVDTFYSSVLADPLLQPLFGAGRPEHVDQLTAFEMETFGGPDDSPGCWAECHT